MAEENFYSYLYGHAATVAFDELAEIVDLSSVDSINRAFAAYVKENTPPFELQEAMLEEKFYASPNEGRNGDEVFIRYDLDVPGLEEDCNAEDLKTYLEDFLDRIGAETGGENNAVVEVDTNPDDRGGVDMDVYVSISGKQIKPDKTNKP